LLDVKCLSHICWKSFKTTKISGKKSGRKISR